MTYFPDISVYDRNGDIVMIVEIKVKTGTNAAWAADMYNKLFNEKKIPQTARYFLLALPDRLYLWEKGPHTREHMEPDWVIDPLPFLNPYYQRIGRAPGSLGHDSFEMVFSSWLSEIFLADTPALLAGYGSWLFESGLGHALMGGRLKREVPA